MAKEILDNKKLAEMLPDLQKEFSLLSSTSFTEYEDKFVGLGQVIYFVRVRVK